MNIQYLVINRSTDSIGRFTSAYDVAVYMLGGERISDYTFIKQCNVQLVTIENTDVFSVEEQLEAA